MNDSQPRPMEPGSPFPPEMQGRWRANEDPAVELIISRDELTWRGEPMPYLERALSQVDEGVILVTLTLPDQMEGDEINLVAMPDDLLSAYNDHFAANFVKAGV